MEQINLMEHLTKKKALIDSGDNTIINEPKKEITATEKRKLCDEYLIPLLSRNFIGKDKQLGKILQAINNSPLNKKLFQNKTDLASEEKTKIFFYQTCLNFVELYSDFILTDKLSEPTKSELITMAFKFNKDFRAGLRRVSNDINEFENGCYITIELNEISNTF